MARLVNYPAVTPLEDVPVTGSITHATFEKANTADLRDPMVASEHMWWRQTGRLAYPTGMTFSMLEMPLLIGDREHSANMRAGVADPVLVEPVSAHPLTGGLLDEHVETRVITEVSEVRRGGRPKLPRDEAGNVLR